jgi:hypothetical protein
MAPRSRPCRTAQHSMVSVKPEVDAKKVSMAPPSRPCTTHAQAHHSTAHHSTTQHINYNAQPSQAVWSLAEPTSALLPAADHFTHPPQSPHHTLAPSPPLLQTTHVGELAPGLDPQAVWPCRLNHPLVEQQERSSGQPLHSTLPDTPTTQQMPHSPPPVPPPKPPRNWLQALTLRLCGPQAQSREPVGAPTGRTAGGSSGQAHHTPPSTRCPPSLPPPKKPSQHSRW